MARHSPDMTRAAEFGAALRALRDAAGSPPPSYDDIARRLYLEDLDVRSGVIGKAHRGELDPKACSMEVLVGLAAFYNVNLGDLHPSAERRLRSVLRCVPELRNEDPDPGGAAAPLIGALTLRERASSCMRLAPAYFMPATIPA